MTVKNTLSFTDRHHYFLSEKVGQGVFSYRSSQGPLHLLIDSTGI